MMLLIYCLIFYPYKSDKFVLLEDKFQKSKVLLSCLDLGTNIMPDIYISLLVTSSFTFCLLLFASKPNDYHSNN